MSFPTANYQALTLVTTIKANWALTGSLAQQGSEVRTITTDPVYILAYPFPEVVKSRKNILVRKLSPIENVTSEVFYDVVRDTFEIACRYTLEAYDTVTRDNAESNVESMCNEIIRIVKLVYNPANLVGVYYETDRTWENHDEYTEMTKTLVRTMRITLVQIRSRVTTVFKGYGGILLFDITNSQGINLPASNYQYTEAEDVQMDQGYGTIEENVTGNAAGLGIAIQFRGKFGGQFSCKIYANKPDIGTNNTNALNLIWQLLASGELPKVYLIWSTTDTESPSHTLQVSTPMYVTQLRQIYTPETLAPFYLQAKIYKPSAFTVI